MSSTEDALLHAAQEGIAHDTLAYGTLLESLKFSNVRGSGDPLRSGMEASIINCLKRELLQRTARVEKAAANMCLEILRIPRIVQINFSLTCYYGQFFTFGRQFAQISIRHEKIECFAGIIYGAEGKEYLNIVHNEARICASIE